MTHPTTSPSGPDAPCGTVLVVEDELQLRRVVERLLAVAGYHVHLASGGLSALATLAEHGDSLCAVYLDLTLPDMRGEAVLERVRAQFPALPVLLTSGGGPPAAAVLAFGATVFLPKPFSPRELRGALARVVASAGVAGQGASPRAISTSVGPCPSPSRQARTTATTACSHKDNGIRPPPPTR